MPARPSRDWWSRCVRAVDRAGSAFDPAAVCGAAWQRKTPKEKRAAARREVMARKKMKRRKHCRTSTKGGKFSKHGRYYRCRLPGGKWSKPRKRSRRKE